MREIPLSNGGVALVDDEDYERIAAAGTWRRSTRKNYVVRGTMRDGKVKTVFMHREVMGDTAGIYYDHINGNKLDNRRSNLRIATNQQNGWNTPKMRRPCASKYKGVNFKRQHGVWHARVRQMGRDLHCGYFRNQIDAAIAYDMKVRELRGEFGRYNFPREGEQSAVA